MNRHLVESATHQAALDEIVREFGDEWAEHSNQVEGGALAEGITARHVVVLRGKRFCIDNREVLFAPDEERILTRLGDEGVEVPFEPPPPSPFTGRPIGALGGT